MQVVILCGGKGTRMGNDELPKCLFPIGDKPILWHIMHSYAYYGFNEFILCLGYKAAKIKEYFAKSKEWNITCVDTGVDTNTGGRIKRVKEYVKTDLFHATYGDGLSDINIAKLLEFHHMHKKMATLTAVKPFSPFGIVGIDPHSNSVTHFEEKPILDHWINGGFFIFHKEIFRYIHDNDILEKESFERVVADKALNAYKHDGFWMCMDTYKDNLRLNDLWASGHAPWAVWKGKR